MKVKHNGKSINWFQCRNCAPEQGGNSFRPSGKFCDPACRSYVRKRNGIPEPVKSAPKMKTIDFSYQESDLLKRIAQLEKEVRILKLRLPEPDGILP